MGIGMEKLDLENLLKVNQQLQQAGAIIKKTIDDAEAKYKETIEKLLTALDGVQQNHARDLAEMGVLLDKIIKK